MDSRKIKRKCSACGKKLSITIYDDRTYKGGNYFGDIDIEIGKGEHIKVGEFDISNHKANMVHWTGATKKVEYWECDECYKN